MECEKVEDVGGRATWTWASDGHGRTREVVVAVITRYLLLLLLLLLLLMVVVNRWVMGDGVRTRRVCSGSVDRLRFILCWKIERL